MNILKNSNYEHYLLIKCDDRPNVKLDVAFRYMRDLVMEVYDTITKKKFNTNYQFLVDNKNEFIGYLDDNLCLLCIPLLEYELVDLIYYEEKISVPNFVTLDPPPHFWKSEVIPEKGLAINIEHNTIMGYFLDALKIKKNYQINKERVGILINISGDLFWLIYKITDYTKFAKLITMMR